MATVREIPLVPQNQRLATDINGTTYILRVNWNVVANCWIMDISDAADVPILRGVPLITGADLFEQYSSLGIGGGHVALLVMTVGVGRSPDEVPTYTNLGFDGRLFYVSA
jgi:hypothetical protein